MRWPRSRGIPGPFVCRRDVVWPVSELLLQLPGGLDPPDRLLVRDQLLEQRDLFQGMEALVGAYDLSHSG